MSKHTPGPWINSALGTVEAKGDLPLCYRHAPRDGLDAICHLTGYFRDQQAANANLIAAAPDLLEALEAILRIPGLAMHPEYYDAVTAIARAKGESS